MLPVVEALLKRALAGKETAESREQEFRQLQQRILLMGGVMVDVAASARRRAERDKAVQEARDALAEIDSIGVQVKDLDRGLLDFPSLLDGQTVLLCWKLGEAAIEHWHTLEAGYEGRQPIDERFRGSKRDRPN